MKHVLLLLTALIATTSTPATADLLPNDVAVTFTLCMSGTPPNWAPCVAGYELPTGEWISSHTMTHVITDRWQLTITLPAGRDSYLEYGYMRNVCTEWETVSHRVVNLPTDGTTSANLPMDSWNNAPMGCGFGQTLQEAKGVCLRLCTAGLPSPGGFCVMGSEVSLGSWIGNRPLDPIGADVWQTCISFPAGLEVPRTIEYLFTRNGCSTLESIPRRTFVIDNSSPVNQILASGWNDAPWGCSTVPVHPEVWGSVKQLYR